MSQKRAQAQEIRLGSQLGSPREGVGSGDETTILSSWWSVWQACFSTVGAPVSKIRLGLYRRESLVVSNLNLFVCENRSSGYATWPTSGVLI